MVFRLLAFSMAIFYSFWQIKNHSSWKCNLGVSEIHNKQGFCCILKFTDDDNFELTTPAAVPVGTNKWEGEDEDDDVKVIISSNAPIHLQIYNIEISF